jgi:hypothetical protein
MTPPLRLALLALALAACRSGRAAEAGAPVTERPPLPSPAAPEVAPAAACDAPCDRDEDCAVATPPDCGDCVALTRARRGDAACEARGCRATTCDPGAWRARCDARTRRCVRVASI